MQMPSSSEAVGLSGIAEFFLGSVSSRVAQYAAVPVLIVK